MSPSKMRRTQWYREGQEARAEGQPKSANPYANDPVWYDRPRCWTLGWDEPVPEPVEEPEEMVLVPREPTIDMILACADLPVSAQDVWERMLAAYEEGTP